MREAAPPTDILDRLDVALERARYRRLKVRTITLDEEDEAAFQAVNNYAWREHLGSEATFFATKYREHFLRAGRVSMVFCENGEEIVVKKKLSKRTKAA